MARLDREATRAYDKSYRHSEQGRAVKAAWLATNKEKRRLQQAAYREANREKTRAWMRDHYEANRDALLALSLRNKFRRQFGISVEEYEAMVVQQDGVCAICLLPEKTGKRLAVDHCHDTGRIRGLLCFGCNTTLGKFGDDAERLRRAADYLERISLDLIRA